MPHFTQQIDENGPLLNVVIAVSAARLNALIQAKQTPPEPIPVRGLVDTGASCTCVDPSVIQRLQLSPTGQAAMVTPSTGNQPPVIKHQYDVGLGIFATQQETPFLLPSMPVVETDLFDQQGFHVLIGRDVLARCLLIYNGATRSYTLSF